MKNKKSKKLIFCLVFLACSIGQADAFLPFLKRTPPEEKQAEEKAEELKESPPARRGREVDEMVSENPENAARVIQILLEEEENPRQRAELISQLGRTEAQEAVEVIMQYLGDEDEGVRLAAAAALGREGREESLGELRRVALSAEESRGRRSFAIRSLGGIKTDEAVDVLSEALDDEDFALRLQALRSLSQIGTAAAYEAAEKAENDTHERVRETAQNILKAAEE